MAEVVVEKEKENLSTPEVVEPTTAAEGPPSPTGTAVTPTIADGDLLVKMQKAMKQVEFYFADANLPYDKFMWTLYSKDPDHWISIQTVGSFKRMREYTSEGIDWLANSLRLSDFLEVDETGTKVRRKTDPQEPKNQFERSIYAKGFGEEDNTLQGRLETLFSQYGNVSAVRMRRDEKKKFKGSVFVEFAEFESVDKFLKADPKPSWEGDELLIMTKEDYCEMKIKEKGLTGKGAAHRRDLISSKKFDAFREMKGDSSASQKNGKSSENKTAPVPKEIFLDFLGNKLLITQHEDGTGSIEEKDVPFIRGVTLKFEGCGGDVTWSEVKDPIKARFDGKPPYIKYSRGENTGLVGFYKVLTEDDIEFVKTNIPKINNHEVSWSLASEEEEKKFEIERAQNAARQALHLLGIGPSAARGRGGGRGGGRGRGTKGGRGGGRGSRGGGGRAGNRNAEKEKESPSKGKGEEAIGEKRKRAVEPDGGPDVGIRGNDAPPAIQSAKKSKTAEGTAAAA